MGFSVRQELTQWINSRANINGVTSIIVLRKCSPTSEQNFSNFRSKLTHGYMENILKKMFNLTSHIDFDIPTHLQHFQIGSQTMTK